MIWRRQSKRPNPLRRRMIRAKSRLDALTQAESQARQARKSRRSAAERCGPRLLAQWPRRATQPLRGATRALAQADRARAEVSALADGLDAFAPRAA